MSDKYSVVDLCDIMDINRSGYYKWIKNNCYPSPSKARRMLTMDLFKQYHEKHKTHGYRWLNAKIKLDNPDFQCSDGYAFRICNYLGLQSQAKHVRNKYKKPRNDSKNYNNLILNKIAPQKPFEVVVSDMTTIKHKYTYYEITWYMDLFNNEIISFGLSKGRGNPKTYYDGLKDLINQKQQYKDLITILHSDHGSVYASRIYNNILKTNGFIHSMSAPGTPTENGAMESINGWTKEELLQDLMIDECDDINDSINKYIHYFNYERPAAALNYLTPIQYKHKYLNC